MSEKKTTAPISEPSPLVALPSRLTEPLDPMVAKAEFERDGERKRVYLEALFRYGHREKATRKAREASGDPGITGGQVASWKRYDPGFAEVERQVHSDYWDEFADFWQQQLRDGRKLTGGEANLIMQQLNRHKSAEYLQQILIQQHQTISYQPVGGFRDEPEAEEPAKEPESPQVVN